MSCDDSEYDLEAAQASVSSIVNGRINEEHSGVVSIWDKEDNELQCTGTVVSYNAVLTAMHCACLYWDADEDNNLQNWRFRKGKYVKDKADLSYEGTTITVADFELRSICSGNYADLHGDDLMLIKTDPGIGAVFDFTPYYVRGVFDFSQYNDPIGTQVRVVGYGRTDPDAPSPGERREAIMGVSSVKPNDGYFEYVPLSTQSNAVTCEGDSGAPVFLYEPDNPASLTRIYGVHSLSTGECDAFSTGRATIIDSFHYQWYWATLSTWFPQAELR